MPPQNIHPSSPRILSAETIIAFDDPHLKALIQDEISRHGVCCDLNRIDVSRVTNMAYLFSDSIFNGDISRWDVSNVTDMHSMFADSSFNGDIGKWNVSRARDMFAMFRGSKFNGPIDGWKLHRDAIVVDMFSRSAFAQDIRPWGLEHKWKTMFGWTGPLLGECVSGRVLERYQEALNLLDQAKLRELVSTEVASRPRTSQPL
jgi:Mycoplasma protein of unknown function, DUF285